MSVKEIIVSFSKFLVELAVQVESGRISDEHLKFFLANPDSVLPEKIDDWTETFVGLVPKYENVDPSVAKGGRFHSDYIDGFVGFSKGEPVFCRLMCGSDDHDEEPFTIFRGTTPVASGDFSQVQVAEDKILYVETFRNGRYTDRLEGSRIHFGQEVIYESGLTVTDLSYVSATKSLLYRAVSRLGQEIVYGDRRLSLPGISVRYLQAKGKAILCYFEF